MGVKESHPNSISIVRRLKLSTMTTSCPRSDKYNDVGHPQNPSPPKTMTFFFSALPLTPLVVSNRLVVVDVNVVVKVEVGRGGRITEPNTFVLAGITNPLAKIGNKEVTRRSFIVVVVVVIVIGATGTTERERDERVYTASNKQCRCQIRAMIATYAGRLQVHHESIFDTCVST